MRPVLTLILALMAATPAMAADNELSFEGGFLEAQDDAWRVFSSSELVPAYGVRGALKVHDRIAIVATYNHARRGASLYSPTDQLLGSSAYFGNEVGLGVKVDYSFWDWLQPYAHLDGLLHLGRARLDGQPSADNNTTLVNQRGTTGGFRGMGGVEFQIPSKSLTAGLYVEAGYTWLAPIQMGDFGDLDFGGFTLRSGVGVRF